MLSKLTLLLAGSLFLMSTSAKAADAENTLLLDLKEGRVTIELYPDKAPKHVERIKTLTRDGFYDGIIFHRVIDGFMAQTGDPTGTGTGGSDMPDLPAEFNDLNFGRGTIGAARTQDPNSANSQWFICFDDCSFLNGQYTIWGQVTDGMEHVDAITRGEPPANPDKIIKLAVAADVQEEKAMQESEVIDDTQTDDIIEATEEVAEDAADEMKAKAGDATEDILNTAPQGSDSGVSVDAKDGVSFE